MNKIYYVAVNGDDINDGLNLERPFRTIGRAAQAMEAGDLCYIREGTYRETVVPSRSGREDAPIRFEAYGNERVVVSGCDEVTEWTRHEGNVYKAKPDWDLGDGSETLVFFDEELGMEAQWPKIRDRLDRSQYALVGAATSGMTNSTIFDEKLQAFPDGHWDGAMVACVNGVGYFMSTAKVTSFAAGTLHHEQWVSSADHYFTKPGDLYFITRTLQALDTEKEWYYDSAEGMLYAIAPEGKLPPQCVIEVKRREYAFDLRHKEHIHIIGVDCRGAGITTEEASQCLIRKSRIYGMDRSFGYRQSIYGRTRGIALGGEGNRLHDCEISHFEGNGISISGARNSVHNCYIHDGNFEASYASMIWMTGAEHRVSRCTITRGGRTSISGVFSRSTIEYCDISFANALTKDSGMIYLFNHDFDGTQIHHNWLHDNLSDHLSFGFYMDAWTSGISFFRNVIWNIPERGMVLNRPIQRTLIYNNTFYRKAIADSSVFCLDDMYGTHMANNLFADGEIRRWGGHSVVSHNRFDADPFVDAESGDFRLRADSPVIGQGIPIPGVTDGYRGTAPDPGAYEFGGEEWVPGHSFESAETHDQSAHAGEFDPHEHDQTASASEFDPLEHGQAARASEFDLLEHGQTASAGEFVPLKHESLLRNGGFESGSFAPWTAAGGTPRLVFECAWDYSKNGGYPTVVRSNRYAAVLGPGERIEQQVAALKPNTSYIFFAGIKSGGEYRQAIEYAETNGGSQWEREPDGTPAIYRDVRYVGPMRPKEWIKLENIDFGAAGQYDNVSIGLNKVIGPVTVEVRIGGPDGELIGAVAQQTPYDAVWRYFGAPLGSVAGVHDVYLVLSGEGQCLLHNIVFHNTFRAGTARMSVHGHDRSIGELVVNRWNWESTLSELHFTTGPETSSVTVAIENIGALAVIGMPAQRIYADDCGLWEQPRLSRTMKSER